MVTYLIKAALIMFIVEMILKSKKLVKGNSKQRIKIMGYSCLLIGCVVTVAGLIVVVG